MTQNDIVLRTIKKNGCQGISCSGRKGWNKGTICPFFKKGCKDRVLNAEAWAKKHGLSILYSSTFDVEHRFKPGDRIRQKDAAGQDVGIITVEKVEFSRDSGAYYRFFEFEACGPEKLSYYDRNYMLADCDNGTEKAKEMP